MARGSLTPVEIVKAGVALGSETAGDATNGHTVVNDGEVFILAHNTNGGSTARTASFVRKRTVDGVAPAVRAVSVAAATTKLIGPFPTIDFGVALDIDVSHAELQLTAYHFSPAS